MKIITDQDILQKKSKNIVAEEYGEIFPLLEDIVEKDDNAAGLAAIQIGIPRKAFVIKIDGVIYRFANCKIWDYDTVKHWTIESCLSLPGLYFSVNRSHSILIEDDIQGARRYRWFAAQAIQHEYDHTIGITLLQSGIRTAWGMGL